MYMCDHEMRSRRLIRPKNLLSEQIPKIKFYFVVMCEENVKAPFLPETTRLVANKLVPDYVSGALMPF